MAVKKRQNFIVQNIGSCESGFVRIHLGETNVGMGINRRLLVDFANALDVANI